MEDLCRIHTTNAASDEKCQLKVTCDKGTNISNNDLDWQYSQISLNRHLYIDGHLA